ncbi:unnamed protein product, partial [Ectocarpus fasciculatus]
AGDRQHARRRPERQHGVQPRHRPRQLRPGLGHAQDRRGRHLCPGPRPLPHELRREPRHLVGLAGRPQQRHHDQRRQDDRGPHRHPGEGHGQQGARAGCADPVGGGRGVQAQRPPGPRRGPRGERRCDGLAQGQPDHR